LEIIQEDGGFVYVPGEKHDTAHVVLYDLISDDLEIVTLGVKKFPGDAYLDQLGDFVSKRQAL
jgi:hypothetical protein